MNKCSHELHLSMNQNVTSLLGKHYYGALNFTQQLQALNAT